jgi:hypothetical protein
MNKSPKLQSNSKSLQRRQYGVLVTATAKAQQVMSSMRGFFFYSSGWEKGAGVAMHTKEGLNTEQNSLQNAMRAGSSEGKRGEKVRAKGGRL